MPPGEKERLNALEYYQVMDTGSEPILDSITDLCSKLFDVPISLVSLLDEKRQWFKSNCGLDPGTGPVMETPRRDAFCMYAILPDAPNVLVIPDATKDDRFKDNVLVTDWPHIRFYAGAALITKAGHKLGTLCLIDTKARPNGLSEWQKQMLLGLAAVVVETFDRCYPDDALDRLSGEKDLLLRAISCFSEGMLIVDAAEREKQPIIFVNDSWTDITGFRKDETYGKSTIELLAGDDTDDQMTLAFVDAMAREDCTTTEGLVYKKKGEDETRRAFRARFTFTPLVNSAGNLTHYFGVCSDVTKDHEYEEMKLQARTRMIDMASAPIFVVGVDGGVSMWNRAATGMTGYAKEDIEGQQLHHHIVPQYREQVREMLARALQGQLESNQADEKLDESVSGHSFECAMNSKSGRRIELLLSVSPMYDMGLVVVCADITSRVQQEQEHKELANLLEEANAPIFGIDAQGRVNIWNANVAEITGFKPLDVLGKRLVDTVVPPKHRESVNAVLTGALKGDAAASIEVRTMDLALPGKERVLLLSATCKRDTDGKIVGVIGVGQDFTARKNLELAKNTFLASFRCDTPSWCTLSYDTPSWCTLLCTLSCTLSCTFF
jgi:PAS domain S-box-containing protein